MFNPHANGEPSRDPMPLRYDPKRLARYRTALDCFKRPDTDTHYDHPTPAELKLAYTGDLDHYETFEKHLADARHLCGAMEQMGGGHGG